MVTRLLTSSSLHGLLILLLYARSAAAYWVVSQSPLYLDARLDPIVNPGRLSGHVHTFVGSNRISASATNVTLRSSSACTTAPVQADKSSYWAPTLYKYYNGAFEALGLNFVNAYYLQRGAMAMQAFPPGLRMLAGNAMATGPQNTTQLQNVVSFVCLNYINGSSQSSKVPDGPCPQGLRAQIVFPSCWDGVNLDSADHKSHLAYPLGDDAANGDYCPASHPIRFITLFYEFIWNVGSQPNNGSWVFANGDTIGYAYHADFMNGWDTEVLQAAITNCTGELGGELERCLPFATTLDRAAAQKCQIDTFNVDGLSSEEVHGKLYSLPGCNIVWNGLNAGAGPCGATAPPANISYDSHSMPAGYKGCYSEPSGVRALSTLAYRLSSNTVEKCRAACSAQGYSIAGMEWGVECWCANQISTGSKPLLDTSCSMPCAGNTSEMCGGSKRLSIYSDHVTLNTTADSSNPATIGNFKLLGCYADSINNRTFPVRVAGDSLEKCAESCSGYQYFGMEFANECYCGDALNVIKIRSSSCYMPCLANSSEYCGGPNALTVYQNPAITTKRVSTKAPISLIAGTRSLGCYADSATARSLQYRAYSNSKNSPRACATHCRFKGYKYSGTESSKECFCGNSLLNLASAANGAAKNGCNAVCSGDLTQTCGGLDRLNIVQDDQYTQTFFTVMKAGRWSFSDCIIDNVLDRSLPRRLSVAKITPEKCLAACLNAGLHHCGMEFSGECWGSARAPTAASAPLSGSSSSNPTARGCNMACVGNASLACGGADRLTYYTYLGKSATSVFPSVIG